MSRGMSLWAGGPAVPTGFWGKYIHPMTVKLLARLTAAESATLRSHSLLVLLSPTAEPVLASLVMLP